METSTIKIKSGLSLYYSDYNDNWSREVSVRELINMNVGDELTTEPPSTCGRQVDDESYRCIYKDKDGIALLHRHWGTSDSENPVQFEIDPKLIWVEF